MRTRFASLPPPQATVIHTGIANDDGQVEEVAAVDGLVSTIRLFERLRDMGCECRPGRLHGETWLMRVFVRSGRPGIQKRDH